MSKNLIPKIAELLGVELGEEFLLRNTKTGAICSKEIFVFMVEDRCEEFNGKVRFKKKSDNGYQYHSSVYSTEIFQQLCEGKYEIVKLPWKPKNGDVYFTFELLGGKWVVRWFWWGGLPNEYALLDKGWIYRTCEEAQAALPKVAAKIGVEYKL